MTSPELRFALASVALAAAMIAAPAQALTARLDDSASPRSRVPLVVATGDKGQPLADAPGSSTADVRFGAVEYRLATAAYVGRHARIYFVVPAQIRGLLSPGGLRMSWRGLGAFAGGSAQPGDRVPVWTGTIREAWMDETIDLNMQLDLRQIRLANGEPFGLESYFEIETLP